MKKSLVWLQILVMMFLALGLFGCSGEPTQELQKFNLGYLATPGQALYFVAQEKGYFREEGLDVELFLFSNSGEGTNAILSGKLDAGAFGTSSLTFISQGAELTIIGGQQSEGHGIIALPEKGEELKNLEDFKGKTIATVRLATGDVLLRGALKEAGIDWEKEVTINELDSPAAVLEAVKKGSVDAGVVWTPYIKLAQEQGLKVLNYSGELLENHPCCRQTVLTAKIKENPQIYEQFMTALIRAYKFYLEKPEETVEIIAKYVKISKDIIKAETYGGHIFSHPDPDKPGVVEFWEYMKKAGYIQSEKNIADYIDTQVYKNALEKLLKRYPDDPVYQKLKADFVQ